MLINGLKPGDKYSEDVRSFALTLHLHSLRAYKYLRERFSNHLPHVSTIRSWYANSNVNGEPGITKKSLITLKSICDEMRDKGKTLRFALSLDEVAIMKNIKWDDNAKKFRGYISFGNTEGEDLPTATNAIVFMLTALNANFSIPIAYYFITTLNSICKHTLLTEIITEISKCGAKLVSIFIRWFGGEHHCLRDVWGMLF